MTQSRPALWPRRVQTARTLCPWHFLGKNTGGGLPFLPQEIFPTQGSNPHLLCILCEFFTTEPPGKPSTSSSVQIFSCYQSPAIQETQVQCLGQEDSLEKGMATHSSVLACRIARTEESGRLQSMGSQRVRQDRATNTFITFMVHPNLFLDSDFFMLPFSSNISILY